MRKLNFSFKSLLLAAGLLVGSANAWAGKAGVVTTNTKINFNGSITAANPCTYTKATDEICGTTTGWFWKSSSSSASDDNGINGEGHFFASNGNISIMMDNPTVGAKDIVNVSFDIAFGGHTGNNAAQTIKLLTSGENLVEESYKNTEVGSSTMGLTATDLEKMNFGGGWRNTNWSERVHFNFTVNYATRKIALVVKNTSGTAIVEKEIDMPEDAGYMRGVNIGSSNQGANSRGVMFDNVYITTTEGDYGDIVSVENSYTVNSTDVYQLFTEIQCPDITLELFGNAARSTTDYYFQYTTGSGWASYEYTSGDIAYECAVTKYNTTAPTAADISGADDPTDGQIAKVTVTVSDKWQTEPLSSKLCLTGPMATAFSGYQPTAGVIYKFTPTEDGYLNFNFYKYNNINYRAWVSGNKYYGTYKSSGNELKTWRLWVTKGTTYYLVSGSTETYQMKMYSFEFVPSISTTIGTTGWSSFASPYALDLSGITGATAYYASAIDASNVTLTSTTATVPAGEGLMLKGTAGAAVTIPVAASGTEITGNKLVGCTVDTDIYGEDKYVLWSDGKFYNLENYTVGSPITIPAGKAYLNAEGVSLARALRIVFDDGEATGIAAPEAAEKTESGVLYNLNGQQVTADYKGIVIKNGKKYFNK